MMTGMSALRKSKSGIRLSKQGGLVVNVHDVATCIMSFFQVFGQDTEADAEGSQNF